MILVQTEGNHANCEAKNINCDTSATGMGGLFPSGNRLLLHIDAGICDKDRPE